MKSLLFNFPQVNSVIFEFNENCQQNFLSEMAFEFSVLWFAVLYLLFLFKVTEVTGVFFLLKL